MSWGRSTPQCSSKNIIDLEATTRGRPSWGVEGSRQHDRGGVCGSPRVSRGPCNLCLHSHAGTRRGVRLAQKQAVARRSEQPLSRSASEPQQRLWLGLRLKRLFYRSDSVRTSGTWSQRSRSIAPGAYVPRRCSWCGPRFRPAREGRGRGGG